VLTIVVPTYNERENLDELLSRIDSALSGVVEYEVVIVDDNSPDGTAERARELSSKYNVRVLVRLTKKGLSSAVLEGFRISEGDIVAVMDADLQHPPELLREMISKIEDGCDIVIASRYVKGGSVEGWSLLRKLISKGAILIARILLPKVRRIRDPVSGYFMLKRHVLEKAEDMNPKGFKILMEILVKGNYSRVCEIPYTFGLRRRGTSKLGTGEIFNYLIHVLNLSPSIVRFALVGAIGTIVNLGVLAVMRYWAHIAHEISSAVAIELSVISNFILNDIWTFRRSRRSGFVQSVLRYHLSNLAGILTQYGTSVALFRFLSLESIMAQFIGIIAGFFVNYFLSKSLVWR